MGAVIYHVVPIARKIVISGAESNEIFSQGIYTMDICGSFKVLQIHWGSSRTYWLFRII
jgi:hypothetical protein